MTWVLSILISSLPVALPAMAQHLIVLDTGHSTREPGAMSASAETEYSYNRRYTRYLAQALRNEGLEVYDVQANGQDKSLINRIQKTPVAALFISIHHDSIPAQWLKDGKRDNYKGYSIFLSAKNAKPEVSVRCSLQIADGFLQLGEVPSLYHAEPIEGENKPLISPKGVHKFDNLVVLKASKAPAVLVEIGVIVNTKESVRLKELKLIQASANMMARQIKACVKQ